MPSDDKRKDLEIDACKAIRYPLNAEIEHVCRILNLKEETEKKVLRIYFKLLKITYSQSKWYSYKPQTIIGGCVYLGCRLEGEAISERDVAAATDVSEQSIRKRYQEIAEILEIPKNVIPRS